MSIRVVIYPLDPLWVAESPPSLRPRKGVAIPGEA